MYFIFFALFLLFCWQLHRNTSWISESLSDYFLKFFFGLVSCIIPTGFGLSEFNFINVPIGWGIGVNILALIQYLIYTKLTDNQSFSFQIVFSNFVLRFTEFYKNQSSINKISFLILGFGVVATTFINLLISFLTYPNEWDSMTGHLVKCAYYLQNGNMNRVQATTWTVDFYPNSLPTLQIFFYHLLGEKGFKLIHYLSYWGFVVGVYAIAKKIFINKNVGSEFFVFLIAALLPTALVQATTTESDIVLSAYLAILVYFMFSYKNQSKEINLILIALMAGVFIGHKVTFLLIAPAIFVVGLHTFLLKKIFFQQIKFFALPFAVGILIFVLPTGYIGNIKEVGKFSLGSLSGPPLVMKWHGIEHLSSEDKIKNFGLNIIRYSSDFLNFDGIRGTETGKKINDIFRIFPNKIYSKFAIEGDRFTAVSGFSFDHPIRFYLERPYWGIISFSLILPILVWLLWKSRQNLKTNSPFLILILATVLHFLSLSYSAVYDPIKARYFMNMAVWCLPLLVVLPNMIGKTKIMHFYLLTCSIFISLSGICTILLTRLHPFFEEKNIFNMSRMEQLTIARPDILKAYENFDKIVPKNAIVALGTQHEHEDFEYPLWGKEFSRKMIPLHPFRSKVKPIPSEAEYVFYSIGVIPYEEGDILLGGGNQTNDTAVEESLFYLRKLK